MQENKTVLRQTTPEERRKDKGWVAGRLKGQLAGLLLVEGVEVQEQPLNLEPLHRHVGLPLPRIDNCAARHNKQSPPVPIFTSYNTKRTDEERTKNNHRAGEGKAVRWKRSGCEGKEAHIAAERSCCAR